MCEAGAWKSFDELEEILTLDDLFILYERTAERQKRLLETVGSAMGATVGAGGSGSVESEAGPVKQQIVGESGTLFGYRQS